MNLKATITVTLLLLANCIGAKAQEFFSTEHCEQLFNIGIRAGVNTSNVTVSNDALPGYNVNSWGTGIEAGVVADINIREYLSLQPGAFFQSRSGEFSYVMPLGSVDPDYIVQAGHWRSYWLSVPVVASLHLNVSSDIRWDIDLGPYFNFNLGSKRTNRVALVTGTSIASSAYLFSQKPKSVDFGVKIGTGLQLFDHYYVGVHYLAGLTGAWEDKSVETYKQTFGGRNKAWTFTLGYNF